MSARVTAAMDRAGRGRAFRGVFLRELHGYLITPVAWLFAVIFLLSAGAFTFHRSLSRSR